MIMMMMIILCHTHPGFFPFDPHARIKAPAPNEVGELVWEHGAKKGGVEGMVGQRLENVTPG